MQSITSALIKEGLWPKGESKATSCPVLGTIFSLTFEMGLGRMEEDIA
jgi:hypothetical protein